jgi:magnesium transporter
MLEAIADKESLLWVDLEDATEFESDCLVEIFNFHPLAVEDCLSDHSEPKIDDYDEYLFLVMHSVVMIRDEQRDVVELSTIELNVFFGRNYVVTHHKTPITTIAQIRNATEKNPERFLKHGSDLLVHAVVDRLVDNYQPLLDRYDRRIDQLEDDVFRNPQKDYLSTIMQTRRDIFNLRRIISPQRDLLNTLTKSSTLFVKRKNLIYFRDVYDHLFRIYGICEGFHDALSSILQAYFSYSSQKLNEVVKHMTVLATLTMPSVIIASIYGMNFKNMPELDWAWGYPFSIALASGISVSMLIWMKFKKWL